MPDLSIKRQLFAGMQWSPSKTWFQNYETIKNHNTVSLAGKVVQRLAKVRKDVRKARRKDRSVLIPIAVGAFDIVNMLTGVIADVDSGYFDSNGWVTPFSTDFSSTIYDVFKAHLRTVHSHTSPSDPDEGDGLPAHVSIVREPLKINFVEIAPGVEIGWQDSIVRGSPPKKVYCRGDQIEQVRSLISDKLWEAYKNVPCVLVKRVVRLDHSHYDDGDGSNLTFSADDLHAIATSERTERIVDNYKRAAEQGLARSLMLNGPPGTGKSTMAQAIIRQLGYRTLRLCVEDITERYVPSIMECVRIFRPDAIIIDDFDRCDHGAQRALLELSEWFLSKARLTIVTVNDKGALDQALIRPGRFDEIITIRQLDKNSIIALLGGQASDDLVERVGAWPVAYINEYRKRLLFMSQEDAAASVEELQQRVAKLNQAYDDLDDDEPFIGQRKRRQKFDE